MKRMTKILALLSIMTALFLSASVAMADVSSPEAAGPGEQSTGMNEGGWEDDFDSYPTDTSLHGVGGWKGWDNDPFWEAFTTDDQAASAPNSVDIVGDADLVHEFTGYTSGQWVFSGKVYVPADFSGQSYLIFLNTYADGGPNNWSVQVWFQPGIIGNDITGATLPITQGAWLDWELTIDLDNDLQSFFIDGQALYTDQSWKDGISGGGAANIGAIDLFANGATSVYYDDLMLMPAGGTTAVQFDAISAESNSSLPGALLALAGLSLVAGLAIWQRRTR